MSFEDIKQAAFVDEIEKIAGGKIESIKKGIAGAAKSTKDFLGSAFIPDRAYDVMGRRATRQGQSLIKGLSNSFYGDIKTKNQVVDEKLILGDIADNVKKFMNKEKRKRLYARATIGGAGSLAVGGVGTAAAIAHKNNKDK